MIMNNVKEVAIFYSVSKHIREFLESVVSFKFQIDHCYEFQ